MAAPGIGSMLEVGIFAQLGQAALLVFVAFILSLAQSGWAVLGIVAAPVALSLALGWRAATYRSA